MCTWQCHHRRCCLQCSGVGLVLFRLCYTRWDSTCRLGARRTHRRSLCSYFALQHVQAAGRRRRPSDIMPWVPKEDRPTMSRDCSFLLPPPYLYTLQFRVYTTIESTMVRLLQYSGTAVHQVVLSVRGPRPVLHLSLKKKLVNVLWARASKHVFVVKATLGKHAHTCHERYAALSLSFSLYLSALALSLCSLSDPPTLSAGGFLPNGLGEGHT